MASETPNKRYQELAEKWLKGTITPEEAEEYAAWYNDDDEQPLRVPAEFAISKEMQEQRLFQAIQKGIKPVIPLWKRNWIRAASIIIIMSLSIGTYWWRNKTPGKNAQGETVAMVQDVPPGTNKATLTLADGSIILLDSVATGNLTNQGNTQIIKLDSGQLAYNTENSYEPIAIPKYNVITTPRGGQYRIVLPDGSKVWLNAASSLKFPTVFTGKERLVELMGEGYFEVAKNAAKPFKVQVNHTIVEAVGTAFNINAYNDEPTQNTTLVEGKVKLSSNAKEITLSPGQQAVVKEDNSIRVNNITNMEEIIGWKDAWFHFDDMDIQSIMRQVSRWYDVDIQYEGSIQKRYTADIERGLPVSSVLGLLEKTQTIKFKIDKRTITVVPVP